MRFPDKDDEEEGGGEEPEARVRVEGGEEDAGKARDEGVAEGKAEPAEEERDISELMWDLNTGEKIKNLTWWWWWWIFFVKNPDNPKRPRQLMVLWSTKNCERIVVNDYVWERNQDVVKKGAPGKDEKGNYRKRKMTFDGMTGIWWYDGKKMHEPYALERSDFTVEWKGAKGYLRPHLKNVYLYSGDPEDYQVLLKKDDDVFDFRMKPWNDFVSHHRYNEDHYLGKMGYNIYKVFGSRLKGHIRTGKLDEDIKGTAYFQKVMVNAPAVPWFWGLFHTENGSYLDYFNPHFGFPIWRKTDAPTSFWDKGYLSLSRKLQFYDAASGAHYTFKKKEVSISKEVVDGLPTFWVEGRKDGVELHLKVRAYSRAYWRFEQRYLGIGRSVLYYNEYPTEMVEFELTGGTNDVKLKDLGYVAGNIEHSWGWLV